MKPNPSWQFLVLCSYTTCKTPLGSSEDLEPFCSAIVKEGRIEMKRYSQSKATQYVLYVLTFGREGHAGRREAAQRRLQHLQLRQRDLPSSSIVFNNLGNHMQTHIVIQHALFGHKEEADNCTCCSSPPSPSGRIWNPKYLTVFWFMAYIMKGISQGTFNHSFQSIRQEILSFYAVPQEILHSALNTSFYFARGCKLESL